VIPIELRRVVEFLNEQMDPAEVLAIEIRQFISGTKLRTLVPTIYGHTQEAARKRVGIPQRWDEGRFFDKLGEKSTPKEMEIAHQIYDWMRNGGEREVEFGVGKENGSVYPLVRIQGVRINPLVLYSDGKLSVQFGALEGKPIFGDLESRRELAERI
jgi:hypothetical protein